MKLVCKCHNYSGCLLAYRQENIEIDEGQPMICPECGKAVSPGGKGGNKVVKLVLGVVVFAVCAAAGYFGITSFLSGTKKTDGEEPSSGQTVVVTAATPQPTPRQPLPPPADDEPQVAEPPPAIFAPQTIDMNVASDENRSVKEEVLKRVDTIPNLSQANRDKLYTAVERARSMGKVLVIPFASGARTISAADAQELKNALDKPEVMKIRDDPTAVFVVLGFADPKGDPKKNVEISQVRAEAVVDAMKNKAGVVNVTHAVAMGGSNLVDSKNLEKNRIVEVWAVLP